jgi:hypothetical protein
LPHPKLAAYREKAVVSQWHRIAFFAAAAAGVTLKNNREKHAAWREKTRSRNGIALRFSQLRRWELPSKTIAKNIEQIIT